MFPQSEIEDFRKYWRRRKPGSSTALHYTSDVRIFFKWAEGCSPDAVTVHDVDRFIVWQQSLGHAPATVTRRLIVLRMFYDYLAYARDHSLANPVVPMRHYVSRGRRLPNHLRAEELFDQYPQYLLSSSEARVIDPATSALAITVGGLSYGFGRDPGREQ